jgi:ribosomal protein L11 methylase PrmA
MSSGLYNELISKEYLIKHSEEKKKVETPGWKIIQPEPIPFISYPYEWSFGMLKDAALLTLKIQKLALKHGMSLKDASAFNIQFFKGKPILIDTLSFEKYNEGKPWVAYKQFVEHFLNPLAIMAYTDVKLNRMSSIFLDGIPLEVASHILPTRSRLNISLLFHIHTHAKAQRNNSNKKLGSQLNARNFSKRALIGMLDSLENCVKKMKWSPAGTQWEDYYEEDKNNYKSESFKHKASLVKKYIAEAKPQTVWDMGANTGYFSKIGADFGAQVIAFDVDYGAIEKNYRDVKEQEMKNLLPLFSDITNPTPAVGWENQERMSLENRGPADVLMALALIHHLAISHNMPFSYQASCFAKLARFVIVEFIEKDDSQVQILLANRKDIFNEYTKQDFESAFAQYFTLKHADTIKGSKRTLYLFEKK